jgi:hypothetical protein
MTLKCKHCGKDSGIEPPKVKGLVIELECDICALQHVGVQSMIIQSTYIPPKDARPN